MLIPPDNFGLVEPGFYRCSKLEADHLPFLETLRLKLLILLDVAKPPRTLKTFLAENKIELFNLGGLKISNHQNTGSTEKVPITEKPVLKQASEFEDGLDLVLMKHLDSDKNDSWMIIEKNLVAAAFEILLDRTKYSVLLVDSSLALVGILRKVQKWNFNSIVNEYRIYTGNSSKSSYNVEVFLELIQPELIPHELDHALRKRDESSENLTGRSQSLSVHKHASLLALPRTIFKGSYFPPQMQVSRSQSEEGTPVADDDESACIEDYEDDMDDDMLSASPQIPANLLRLVEQRKTDDDPSPGTSPDSKKSSRMGSRSGSMDLTNAVGSMQRRKSSVDSRYIRANNNRFRDTQRLSMSFSPRRASIDASLKQPRVERERSLAEETKRLKQQYYQSYYQPYGEHATRFNVIKLRIPAEHNLVQWFVRGRDFWQSRFGTEEERQA